MERIGSGVKSLAIIRTSPADKIRDSYTENGPMTGYYRSLSLWCILLWIVGCRAEDAASDALTPDVALCCLCLFFAIMCCWVGVAISYFVFLEDSLLRRYRSEGEEWPAHVVSSEFARAGHESAEYWVLLEYKRFCPLEGEKVKIRKKLRVARTDLHPSVPAAVRLEIELGSQVDGLEEPVDDSQQSPHFLHMWILPEYPKSALPKAYIERAIGSRSLTLLLVLFFVLMSGFALYLGYESLLIEGSPMLWIPLLELLLVGTGGGTVHVMLRSLFEDYLRQEYLEGSGSVTTTVDESTLTSFDDDSFLNAIY